MPKVFPPILLRRKCYCSDMPRTDPVRVFVSYTHDSAEHKDQVLEFSEFLTRNGIDVTLDQWKLEHRQDWYAWAIGSIENADYVIVIASARYREVADGYASAESNRGLQSEAALLREKLHSDRPAWTRKLLPVLLPGHTPAEIPAFLQPQTADHYFVTEFTVFGSESLLRVLTGQAPYVKPAPGRIPDLPPRTRPRPASGLDQNVVSRGGITIVNQGGDQNVSM
ncbi:toll/interleukin-1 receptor domain-containing protein [Amycolatopsis kentuckyensis]|uniref:toll/interleukin-1 receptor domain-containing protein n=1 Tax=Amycolatopsis kentuckyensis TaxID=218823 RepID=UPI001ABF4413|nr:toll/interleukin-1 receptor domain-containing protein [Amycolatopsis kentuckyensis]